MYNDAFNMYLLIIYPVLNNIKVMKKEYLLKRAYIEIISTTVNWWTTLIITLFLVSKAAK